MKHDSYTPTPFLSSSCLVYLNRDLIKYLVGLCKESASDRSNTDASWLYAMPVLHFLNDESSPYEFPKFDSNHRDDKWWGIKSLGGPTIRNCKEALSLHNG